MDNDDINYILLNSPDYVTIDNARDALVKTNNNIIDAIALLWNIETNQKPENPKSESQIKIEELREISDAHDLQIQEYIKCKCKNGVINVNDIKDI